MPPSKKILFRTFFTFAAVCVFTASASAQSHPSLFFKASDIPAMQRRATNADGDTPWAKRVYDEEIKPKADDNFQFNFTGNCSDYHPDVYTPLLADGSVMMDAAIVWLIEGDTAMRDKAKQRLIDYANNWDRLNPGKCNNGTGFLMSLWHIKSHVTYDILFLEFTQAERDLIEQEYFEKAEQEYDRGSTYADGGTVKHYELVWNGAAWINATMFLDGLTRGDTALTQKALARVYQRDDGSGTMRAGLLHIIQAGTSNDGKWWEDGRGYTNFALMPLCIAGAVSHINPVVVNGQTIDLLTDRYSTDRRQYATYRMQDIAPTPPDVGLLDMVNATMNYASPRGDTALNAGFCLNTAYPVDRDPAKAHLIKNLSDNGRHSWGHFWQANEDVLFFGEPIDDADTQNALSKSEFMHHHNYTFLRSRQNQPYFQLNENNSTVSSIFLKGLNKDRSKTLPNALTIALYMFDVLNYNTIPSYTWIFNGSSQQDPYNQYGWGGNITSVHTKEHNTVVVDGFAQKLTSSWNGGYNGYSTAYFNQEDIYGLTQMQESGLWPYTDRSLRDVTTYQRAIGLTSINDTDDQAYFLDVFDIADTRGNSHAYDYYLHFPANDFAPSASLSNGDTTNNKFWVKWDNSSRGIGVRSNFLSENNTQVQYFLDPDHYSSPFTGGMHTLEVKRNAPQTSFVAVHEMYRGSPTITLNDVVKWVADGGQTGVEVNLPDRRDIHLLINGTPDGSTYTFTNPNDPNEQISITGKYYFSRSQDDDGFMPGDDAIYVESENISDVVFIRTLGSDGVPLYINGSPQRVDYNNGYVTWPSENQENTDPDIDTFITKQVNRDAPAVNLFFAEASDADGDTLTYEFDRGDGSDPIINTDGQTLQVYHRKGTWTVTLTVTDSAGGTAQVSKTISNDRKGNRDAVMAAEFLREGERNQLLCRGQQDQIMGFFYQLTDDPDDNSTFLGSKQANSSGIARFNIDTPLGSDGTTAWLWCADNKAVSGLLKRTVGEDPKDPPDTNDSDSYKKGGKHLGNR